MANSPNGLYEQDRGDYATIEISDNSKLLAASIKGKLETVSPSPFGRCCIYKVHEKFRKINAYAYTPEMVSIGPFHHGKLALQPMEDHKLRYMDTLLSQVGDKGAILEECVEAISRLEMEARKCYSEPVELDRNKFVQMMIVDGLFTIELFRKSAGEERIHRDDPIFNNIWGMASLVRDMILLENQLPMFVLERLFDITMVNQDGKCKQLKELAIRFFNPLMRRDEDVLASYFISENYSKIRGKHLLDLLGKTFHDFPSGADSNRDLKLKHVPSVTELRQAGVKFKKGSNAGSFLDIRFVDGVLTIPPVLIQDPTDTVLRNLIASEQCCDGRSTYMTSYAFLMDSLIDSSNDVAFLRNKGIITNYLGNDECASVLFNKLCGEVTLVNFYYSELCDQLNAFYRTRWHVWRATLRREYFQSPWRVISVVAVGLLFILTLTSTMFAMLSFFVHKS